MKVAERAGCSAMRSTRALAVVFLLIAPPASGQDAPATLDSGSGIRVKELTSVQLENLVLLGRVWGFLKYHHPAVVGGTRLWDDDLFRVMPSVLAARDGAEARRVLVRWVDSLGDVPPCASCVKEPHDRPILPPLAWLADRDLLGEELSRRLLTIHARRPDVDRQFYVSLVPGIGCPDFDTELGYGDLREPDAEYRILAVFRLWNIIEYWYPYRDLVDREWDSLLREFLPRVVKARTRDDYTSVMLAMVVRIRDTHANLWNALDVRPPRGAAQVPVRVRFIENRAVVVAYANAILGPRCGLRIGDVIRSIDGVPIERLVERWRPWYTGSNEASRLRDIGWQLTRGAPGPARMSVDRGGAIRDVTVTRVDVGSVDLKAHTDDVPGPTFRRLSPDLAYLKLSTVKKEEVPDYLRGMAGARCLVIDIRNYPPVSMVYDLGEHLVRDSTAFVVFTWADMRNPGAFSWTDPVSLIPRKPYFDGGVAILVDEQSQSHSEFTAMAMRVHPGAVVVGSTTAGADGNVSPIALPGGLHTLITGIGVFYPDHRPTQRIGILPDLEVRPTVAGFRAGRDEVLEAAVKRVLGRAMNEAELTSLRSDTAAP